VELQGKGKKVEKRLNKQEEAQGKDTNINSNSVRNRNKQLSKELLYFLECVDVCQKFPFK
jgi:hypothetical protein